MQQAVLVIGGGVVAVALIAVIWQTRPAPVDDEARPVVGTAQTPAPPAVASPSTSSVPDAPPADGERFEPSALPPASQPKLEPAEIAVLEERRAEYDQQLQTRPDDPYVLNRKGQVLERLGRVADAAACFEQAVKLSPDTPGYHFNLARVNAASGQSDRAISEYREVVRLQPDDYGVRNTLAMLLQRKGEDEAAIPEFQRALTLGAKEPAVHLGLGVSLERVGRVPDAVREYERYVAMQPGSADSERLKLHLTALQARSQVK